MASFIQIENKIKSFNKSIEVSGDKSISIRCVLLASQAIGKSKIYNLLESEDVINSLRAIKKLGIKYKKSKNFYEIYGFGLNGYKSKRKIKINAGNSGTLARLILGLLVNCNNFITIEGDQSLSSRDFSRVTEPLKMFGSNLYTKNGKLPVKILGTNFLRPIRYIEKLGSAQCKSAVMLAAMKTPGKTIIKARKSRNHTEKFFKYLNIPLKSKTRGIYDYLEVRGVSNYKGFNYVVPGDISSSSFFLVLTLLSKRSKIRIKNVNINESRVGIIKILNQMGAKILLKNRRRYKGETIANIIVESNNNLKAINCDKELNSSAIDEFLIIFLVAAKAKGVSTFKELGELNNKESPRLDIAIEILNAIGIKVIRKNNDIKIYGKPDLNLNKKYVIKNFKKDHRVFMMACIAALVLGGKWKIYDRNSVNSSFPKFFKIIKELGGIIN